MCPSTPILDNQAGMQETAVYWLFCVLIHSLEVWKKVFKPAAYANFATAAPSGHAAQKAYHAE
jgi:hypothetical protein